MSAKELARQFIQQRAVNRAPLPSQDEIKRQLGFGLIAAERRVAEKLPAA